MGSSSITGDETILFADNMSFDGTPRGGKMISDGQLWIGSTASRHVRLGSLTAGAGVTITNGPGTITITNSGAATPITLTGNTGGILSPTAGNFNILGASTAAGTSPVTSSGSGSTLTMNVQKSQAIAATDATKIGLANFNSAQFTVDANGFVSSLGAGFVWTDVSGAVNAAVNNGYFVTGTCTSTLPSAPAQGDTIKYIVDHASQLLTIQASAGKVIRLGNTPTAAAGTAVSTLQGDAIELVYRTSDTTWLALSSVGQWNLT